MTATQETIDRFVINAHGNMAGVKEMLAEDPELINTRSNLDETPLGAASHVGNLEMVQLLIERGTDTASITGPDATALNAAAWHGDEATAAWLVEQGAPIDVPDFEGKTAIQRAEENGHDSIVAMMRG